MSWLKLAEPTIRILAIMPKNAELGAIANRSGWRIDWAASIPVELGRYEIILCERCRDWKDRIRQIAAAAPHGCVILVSAESDDHLWQDVIDCGGYDVLTKPFQPDRVMQLVQFAASHRKLA